MSMHHPHPLHSTARGPVPPTQASAWIAPVIIALVIGMAFVGVYVGLQRDPQPDHLPLAVVGTPLANGLSSGLGNRVQVIVVDSPAQGRTLVQDGQVVASLGATSPSQLQLDYAGAQGLSESGAARQLVSGFASSAGLTVREQDLVPLVRYDSRGLVSFYVVFAVTLSSFILAQALTGNAARVRLRHRLMVLGGFAVVIGIAAAVLAGPVYGAVKVPLTELTATLVALSAASALGTKALTLWLGPAGVGLAVLVLTVAGNATSGASTGVHLLPTWARALSVALPQGAAVRALESAGYFGGGAIWSAVLVLGLWVLISLLLIQLHHRRSRTRAVPRTGAEALSGGE